MIRYLGSKHRILPAITRVCQVLAPGGTVLDLFSGSARVTKALKEAGFRVIANDYTAYGYVLATCYGQADREDWLDAVTDLIAALNDLNPEPGWFTKTYCRQARYFEPENGARVDAMREALEDLALPWELKAIALTSILEALSQVDRTTGHFRGFLHGDVPKARTPIRLEVPELTPASPAGPCHALCEDVLEIVENLEGDIAYLDPPYNNVNYLDSYHVLESLVLWDKPEVEGRTCKREDRFEYSSPFNRKKEAADAITTVVKRTSCPNILLSYDARGIVPHEQLLEILATRGRVSVLEYDRGQHVNRGRANHSKVTERLYVVTPDEAALDRVLEQF